jgi:hypothetical protein
MMLKSAKVREPPAHGAVHVRLCCVFIRIRHEVGTSCGWRRRGGGGGERGVEGEDEVRLCAGLDCRRGSSALAIL